MVEMVKTRINGQWDIILPKHRADRPQWDIKNGGWEKERLQKMYERIAKDEVVYYVGAEEADMCGLLTKWGAKLVMLEPNPKVWPNALSIWVHNNLEAPLACFVGFASNQSTYYKNDEFVQNRFPACADGPVIGDHGFMELRNHNAPEITLDELSRIIGHVPNHISIDVEGSEWEVLKGAEQTIMQHKPILWVSIHPEFMIQQYGQYSGDLRNWIKDRGYSETLLAYDHECHFMYLPI